MAFGSATSQKKMNQRAQIRLLADRRRLHLNDGPIDLILEAWGAPGEIQEAYRAACVRFATVLDELCSELTYLRQPTSTHAAWPDEIGRASCRERVCLYV